MRNKTNELKCDFKKIISLLSGEGAKKIGIFGSCTRGNMHPKSDIDILVKFSKTKSLLEIVRLERQLSNILGRKVDLLTEKSISPYLIKRIKQEERMIYG